MIVDVHTHIFPEMIRNNKESYFPAEPEFKLLYGSPKSKMVGAKALISSMDEQGVNISVIFGFLWKDSQRQMMNCGASRTVLTTASVH